MNVCVNVCMSLPQYVHDMFFFIDMIMNYDV